MPKIIILDKFSRAFDPPAPRKFKANSCVEKYPPENTIIKEIRPKIRVGIAGVLPHFLG